MKNLVDTKALPFALEKGKILSMFKYAVCEIGGKQVKVIPNVAFNVALQSGKDDIEAKVLLISEDGKLQLGKPYLKEPLKLKRVEDIKGKKIRVAKFHAKANYRKVTGAREKLTKIIFAVKKSA